MIAPIGAFTEIGELLKYPNRCLPFDRSHEFGNRHLGRDLHQQMHMVLLHIQFDNDATQASGKDVDAIVHFLTNRTTQYAVPILRHPYDVILTAP
jgi:hypothetical protein